MYTWRGKGFLCHSEDPRYKQAKEALDRNMQKIKGRKTREANAKGNDFLNSSWSDKLAVCNTIAVPYIQKLFKEASEKMPTKDTQFVYMLTELRKIIKKELGNEYNPHMAPQINNKIDDICTRAWLENILRDLYKNEVTVGAKGSKGAYTNKLKKF